MSKKVKEPRFWMVWNSQGRQPTRRHFRRDASDREAERLASSNPGQSFFVLKAVGGVKAGLTPITGIKMDRVDDDEIPF